MNKALVSLMLALVAISAPAMAGGSIHAVAGLPTGETHTLDISVNEDGTYTLMLDGAPVDPTTLPAPGIPALPGAPEVPALPAAPGVPEVPALPTLP